MLARIRLASKDEFSTNKFLSHQRQKKCAATFNTLEPSKKSVPSYIVKLLVETKWPIVAILYLQHADKHKKKLIKCILMTAHLTDVQSSLRKPPRCLFLNVFNFKISVQEYDMLRTTYGNPFWHFYNSTLFYGHV